MKDERFPTQRKSKLDSRGDGQFQVFKRINDNAYKIDLPFKYNVLATSNISDLSPFDLDANSRMNHFEEGGNDTCFEGQIGHSSTRWKNGDFSILVRPITQARAKWLREDFRNLAKAIVEEMHQEWAKETKIPIHVDRQSKILLFVVNWALNLILAVLGHSPILVLFSLVILSI